MQCKLFYTYEAPLSPHICTSRLHCVIFQNRGNSECGDTSTSLVRTQSVCSHTVVGFGLVSDQVSLSEIFARPVKLPSKL